MSINNALPDDYDKRPKGSSGRYLKLAKGDAPARFRILSLPPISGLLKWGVAPGDTKDRPVRIKLGGQFPDGYTWQANKFNPAGGERKPQYFLAFPIWRYDNKQVEVWEVTQSIVQEQYEASIKHPDFGDPLGYDFTLTRSDKNETTYLLQPSPQKPLAAAVQKAWETCQQGGFDLTRLYDGGDPFSGPPVAAVAGGDEDIPF